MTNWEVGGTVGWSEMPDETYSLAIRAFDAVLAVWEGAPVPDSGERRWFVSDHDALSASMAFEDRVRSKGFPPEVPTGVRAELTGYLDRWHAALPFNEAEREIVCSAYQSDSGEVEAYREIPSQIRRQEFEIVNAGLRSVVRGRDLMRRWWAWRREADEFAEQGSLSQAKAALIQLVGHFVPPENMPPHISYDLQGSSAPTERADCCHLTRPLGQLLSRV